MNLFSYFKQTTLLSNKATGNHICYHIRGVVQCTCGYTLVCICRVVTLSIRIHVRTYNKLQLRVRKKKEEEQPDQDLTEETTTAAIIIAVKSWPHRERIWRGFSAARE